MLPLIFAAAPLATAAICPTQQIVATAQVRTVNRSTWPDYPHGPMPDAATTARRRSASFAAMGLEPLTEGLEPLSSTDVDWPVTGCAVPFAGGSINGLLSDGRVVWLNGDTTISVGTTTEKLPAPPVGPTVGNARFIASISISVENWQVGVWRFPDGRSIIAAYKLGDAAPQFPVLKSARPVIGISYLGAPDSFGGNLTILQSIGHNSYRWSRIGWSENAVRTPVKAK